MLAAPIGDVRHRGSVPAAAVGACPTRASGAGDPVRHNMPTLPRTRRRRRLRAGLPSLAVLLALLLCVIRAPSLDAGTLTVVSHGSRAAPVIALTFDDGYSPTQTRRIFAILTQQHVMATFFPYGRSVAAAPQLWRSIAAAGYPIANHTMTHAQLTNLSRAQIRWELTTARQTIERITGKPMVRVYRPPYGAYNATVQQEAAAVGFATTIMWDVTSADTAQHSSAASIQRRALTGTNGTILLMHCGPAVTPTILEGVIRGYRARGFRFVTIPELLGARLAPWPTSTPKPTATPTPPSASPSTSPSPTDSGEPFPTPSGSPSPTPATTPSPTPSGSASPTPTAYPEPFQGLIGSRAADPPLEAPPPAGSA
jgi:peptidoglycan-N-acetylglucosamine deacetylase